MQAFFDCLRAEVSDRNIKVCVMSPGYIKTNLSQNAVCADGSVYGGSLRAQKDMAPEVIKLFPCSNQLSIKFQLLIKTRIPRNKEASCFKSLRLKYLSCL